MTNKYDLQILSKIEKKFNWVLLIGGLVSFMSAVAIYFSDISNLYAAIDFLFAVVLIVLFVYRNHLSKEVKVYAVMAIPILLGSLSFMDGGFASGAITLFLLTIAVSVVFLPVNRSILVISIVIVVYLSLWLWSNTTGFEPSIMPDSIVWTIQFLLIVLFTSVIFLSVYILRQTLIDHVEKLEKSNNLTYHLAYYDQLTGLPKQSKFLDLINERNTIRPLQGYLVVVSMRNLSVINSIYSQEIGDELLKESSEIFNGLAKENEIIGRVSGNELIFFIEEQDLESLRQRIYSLNEARVTGSAITNIRDQITYYLGYVSYDGTIDVVEEAYHKAMLALTYAKYHWEEDMVAYDLSFEQQLIEKQDLKNQLKIAIEQKNFTMNYQTKVDIRNDQVVGVEALARWNKDGRAIGPGVFVPLIEEINLSISFSKVTIEKAFEDYKRLKLKYEEDISLSINISPTFLLWSHFIDYVDSVLIEYDVPAERIIFEVTEEVLIVDMQVANEVLKLLQQRGIRVSIDDFGSGYSSINYLTKLNINEIKFDRSFINQMIEDQKLQRLLRNMIHVMKDIDLSVVAEGVETKDQCQLLRDMKCHIVQGYYFSKPTSLDLL